MATIKALNPPARKRKKGVGSFLKVAKSSPSAGIYRGFWIPPGNDVLPIPRLLACLGQPILAAMFRLLTGFTGEFS
ncbi:MULTISPECIES: hypothetical protein [unclassified Pseudomonas]|uniref:hypothetical protein n=1 Tax=unclassified Pseudomonas TaxID=196821 RepID=UPI000F7499B2|nr:MULTISPECIES: hypothetical protein [unclassified Pseudomonas]